MPSPLREIERNTPETIVEQRWIVWTLADDVEAYGQNAGKHIITTENGEDEVTSAGMFSDDVDAQELVDEHNAGRASR